MPAWRSASHRARDAALIAELSEALDDATAMATATVRFRVKNLVIVRTLRERADYDDEYFLQVIRQEFEALAEEMDLDARRVRTTISEARPRRGRAAHAFDYRHVDLPNLVRRERTSRALADRLRGLAAASEVVRDVLVTARLDALDDLTANLTRPPMSPLLDEAARVQALSDLRDELGLLAETAERPPGRGAKRSPVR